ncbi:hypothetical protein [Amnibacterium soli]
MSEVQRWDLAVAAARALLGPTDARSALPLPKFLEAVCAKSGADIELAQRVFNALLEAGELSFDLADGVRPVGEEQSSSSPEDEELEIE